MAKKNLNMGTGSGVSYTPDPTVNGPWTHTRPDIPLFKTAPVTAPTSPTSSTTTTAPTAATPARAGGAGAGMRGDLMNNAPSWQQMKAQNMGGGAPSWQQMKAQTTPVPNTWQNVKAGIATPMRGSGMALGGAGRGISSPAPVAPQIGGELPPTTSTGGMPVTGGELPPVVSAAPAPAAPAPARTAQPMRTSVPRQRMGYANALAGTYGKTI